MAHLTERMRYRLVTGTDLKEFCLNVSVALDEGYELYGSPSIAYDGDRVIVAQAVVLPAYEAVRIRTTSSAAPVQPEPTDRTEPGQSEPGSVG